MRCVSCRPAHRRGAFSLVELLVIMAIIATLIGMLLPAVQKVREASDRVMCQNNFKQIGVAIHIFADSNAGDLPIGSSSLGTINRVLLPYIEQQNVYDTFSVSAGKTAVPNQTPQSTRIPTYLCPSTPNPTRLITGTGYTAAPTDYIFFSQITTARITSELVPYGLTTSPPVWPSATTGTWNSPLLKSGNKISDCPDGLSNTFINIFEEADKPNTWYGGNYSFIQGGTPAGGDGTWAWDLTGGNAFRSYACGDEDPTHQAGKTLNGGTSVAGSCIMNISNSAAIFSFHKTGCNFAFGDGSVRYLPNNTSKWIVYALATKNGGESFGVSPQ